MLGKRSRDANVVCLIFAGTRVVVYGKHGEIFCKVHDALSTIVGKMIFIFYVSNIISPSLMLYK